MLLERIIVVERLVAVSATLLLYRHALERLRHPKDRPITQATGSSQRTIDCIYLALHAQGNRSLDVDLRVQCLTFMFVVWRAP